MIIATNVTKKFGRLVALNNVSATCNKGECIALIGPNGSGKTTLIKSLAINSPQLAGNKITNVTLLGYKGKLEWKQNEDGLSIKMPSQKPCENAVVLKISGAIK